MPILGQTEFRGETEEEEEEPKNIKRQTQINPTRCHLNDFSVHTFVSLLLIPSPWGLRACAGVKSSPVDQPDSPGPAPTVTLTHCPYPYRSVSVWRLLRPLFLFACPCRVHRLKLFSSNYFVELHVHFSA